MAASDLSQSLWFYFLFWTFLSCRNAWDGDKDMKIEDEESEKLLNGVQEKQLKFDIDRMED